MSEIRAKNLPIFRGLMHDLLLTARRWSAGQGKDLNTRLRRSALLVAATWICGGALLFAPVLRAEEASKAPQPHAIETTALKPAEGARRIEGVGSVLSPDQLLQLDGDIRAAGIASKFSKGTYERFKATSSLARQTLEAAEKQASTDEAQLQLLENRLRQTWGDGAPFLAEDARAALIGKLANGSKALVRVDLSELASSQPRNVRIIPLQGGAEQTIATLWAAPSGNQAMPGVSYFAIIDAAAGLRPGDRGRVFAERAESASGVMIPSAAVIVYAGQSWCYVETAPKTYERRVVSLEHPVDDGYIVTSGFAAGTRVVVHGASVLLAREAGPGDLDDDEGGAANKDDGRDDDKPKEKSVPSKDKDETPTAKDDDAGKATPAAAAASEANQGNDANPPAASGVSKDKDDGDEGKGAAAGSSGSTSSIGKPAEAGSAVKGEKDAPAAEGKSSNGNADDKDDDGKDDDDKPAPKRPKHGASLEQIPRGPGLALSKSSRSPVC